MTNLVLFCKSYHGDLLRFQRLWASIQKYNVEKIPFYVSVPASDLDLFKKEVEWSTKIYWVTDEQIVGISPGGSLELYKSLDGRFSQQIIKSEFWRLDIAENYLCLDSDCEFIRGFFEYEFLSDQKTPYTVMHQQKEFRQLVLNKEKNKIFENILRDSRAVKEYFGRKGPDYDFGPSPLIWNRNVWADLYDKFLKPNDMDIWSALTMIPTEIKWYGESLLRFRSIELKPIEPLMRVYHYYWEYKFYIKNKETNEKLAANFMGIVKQSNWEFESGWGVHKKKPASLLLRYLKRLLN